MSKHRDESFDPELIREINGAVDQCMAHGHDYHILSSYEEREPLVINCLLCGAVWPVMERSVKTMDTMLEDLGGE